MLTFCQWTNGKFRLPQGLKFVTNSFPMSWLFSDFSLLVKRIRMEWENMSTLDLITLASKLVHTLDSYK